MFLTSERCVQAWVRCARAHAHGVSLSPTVLRVCASHACGCAPSLARVCARVGALCGRVRKGAQARAQRLVILGTGDHPHLLEGPTGRIHAIFGLCVGALHASDFAGCDCADL